MAIPPLLLLMEDDRSQLPGELPRAFRPCKSQPSRELERTPFNSAAPTNPDWSRTDLSKDCRQVKQGVCADANADMEGVETPMAKYGEPAVETHKQSHNDDADPLKVFRRLDDIIGRLLKSCNEKVEISSHPPDHLSDPLTVRDLVERLERIIERLSERGRLERLDKEDLCVTPPAKSNTAVSGGGSTSISLSRRSDTAPITPKALFTRSGSSEKIDSLASPTAARLSSRFSAALSFLSSPRRAGFISLKSGSPGSHKAHDRF